MTVSLTLPPELEEHVLAISAVKHIPVEEYVLSLVQANLPVIKPAPVTRESEEDFTAAMTMLHRPGEAPLYPDETWSRATIYQDHD